MNVSVARRHITIGSRTLSYLAAGSRPGDGLVVFLHAFPLNAEMWAPQLRAIPEGWAAVAPDFRGFGGSTPDDPDGSPRADARIEDYAEDVGALMDAVGATRAALCGCSMGGYAALAALRCFPARAAAVLLADTRATSDGDAARAARSAMLDLLDREGPSAVAAEMRAKLVGPTSRAERPDVLATIDRLMDRATASGVGHAVSRMLNRPDATADLRAYRGAVAIAVGEEDSLTPPAEAAAMAAAAPGSRVVVIPRAGHLPNLEAPDAFNGALRAWLDSIARVTA